MARSNWIPDDIAAICNPLEGTFYRAVQHDASDVMDTKGTREAGGRYNPPGEFGALYCSDSAGLSLREESAQGEPARARVVPLAVSLARVLDLADDGVLRRFALSHAQLTADEHETTRRLGRAAREAGVEALLVPSAHAPGRNLVVFLDRLRPGSHVRPGAVAR